MKYTKMTIISIFFIFIQLLEARSYDMDKMLDKTIKETNLQLPKKIDKVVTLEKMSRVNETIQYFYKLNYTTKSPNMDTLIISTRNRYCENPQSRAIMTNGYRYYYNYKLATGVLDLEFFISKEHCKKGADEAQRKKSLPKTLKTITNIVAMSLPTQIDAVTTLVSVFSMGMTVTYIKEIDINNKLINDLWIKKKTREQIIQAVKEDEIKSVCNEPTMGKMIKTQGVKAIIRYNDLDKRFLFEHTITKDTCK